MKCARAGIGYVPQGREIFASLTVQENLDVALRRPPGARFDIGHAYELFASLRTRRKTLGGRLSGGEQQMLAVARALVGNPQLLLLDEPFEGLAATLVDELRERLGARRGELTLLIAEHSAE